MRIQRQVGHNVRRLRLERGMTQLTLSFEAGIALNYLNGIESGKRNPTIDVVGRLAKALRVLPADLFAPASEREPMPKNLPRGRNVHHQGRRTRKPGGK
jgi:transcriptional regulator with XRE-family HTH domain